MNKELMEKRAIGYLLTDLAYHVTDMGRITADFDYSKLITQYCGDKVNSVKLRELKALYNARNYTKLNRRAKTAFPSQAE